VATFGRHVINYTSTNRHTDVFVARTELDAELVPRFDWVTVGGGPWADVANGISKVFTFFRVK
jgi:hypothetical protein